MMMRPFSRRAALSAFALFALAACGSATGDNSGNATNNADGIPDMYLGDANAPVTLIEYASVTCPACLQFHETVVPTLKAEYIDTGKVKYVFREYPTPPANVAIAGFAIARCAGDDKYFDVLDDLFAAQPGILAAARAGAVRPALQAVAERHGIVGEDAFNACITDREIRENIADVIFSGDDYNVTVTPTLILQGEKLEPSLQTRTAEGLSELIDLELAALGLVTLDDDAPAEAVSVDETPDEAATEIETEDAPAASEEAPADDETPSTDEN